MFVCIVHCGAEYFLGTSGQQSAMHEDDDQNHETTPSAVHHEHEKDKAHGSKKSCGEGKDCNCCNQHSNYVIKENTSGSPDFQLTALQVAVYPLSYQSLPPVPGTYHLKISWPDATGPPRSPEQPLFIKNRSLLI